MSSRARIGEYLRRFGAEVGVEIPAPDPDGYSQVKRGSAVVGINVLEDRGVLMLLAPMLPVPSSRREELYRFLLEKNFLSTSDAAFAIDEARDAVCLRAMQRLDGIRYEEFTALLDTVSRLADQYDDELRARFAG
jgi:hypothetical protein